ncbi:MAG: Asp-tRNA(Asn)/Glu-tRNA(Gln) amidotransferase subunit GatB [Candidatus Omnitrophota bacterium]
MSNYEIVIGLEAHVHLLTESKAFCACSTKFGLPPNSSTCPVCLGLPGALPVLNEKAFLYALKVALALNCKIQGLIKFDRKNYYYPDLPKNFQISQYDKPLAYTGFIEIESKGVKKKIRINRVHLEEDAGKLIHDAGKGLSYVDLNRAGVPLLEIVTEPDMRSPDEAGVYLQDLKSILLYLGVSDCNMEEGSLRCDANISVRRAGERTLGVKAELKNMNSFKAVRDALSYEAQRQTELLQKGEKIVHETRLWSEAKAITVSMRTKEETHDYRYFSEPDLVPFTVDKDRVERIRGSLPELPQAKKKRLMSEYALSEYDADVLTRDMEVAEFFEETARLLKSPKEIANWLLGDIASILNERKNSIGETRFKPLHLAEIIKLIHAQEITGKIAKEILPEVFITGASPKKIVEEKGLEQIKDPRELTSLVEGVLAENEKSASDYKKGKKNALTFLVGQVMRKTRGKANPQKVNEILRKKLENQPTKDEKEI